MQFLLLWWYGSSTVLASVQKSHELSHLHTMQRKHFSLSLAELAWFDIVGLACSQVAVMLARDYAPARGASKSSMCRHQRVAQTGGVAMRGLCSLKAAQLTIMVPPLSLSTQYHFASVGPLSDKRGANS